MCELGLNDFVTFHIVHRKTHTRYEVNGARSVIDINFLEIHSVIGPMHPGDISLDVTVYHRYYTG